MRYINRRFTYLLTYLLTYADAREKRLAEADNFGKPESHYCQQQ